MEEEIIKKIIYDYNVNCIGSPTLSEKYGISKRKILQILKDNGCSVGKSGRKYKGGKSAADKRYYEKNKENISERYKKWSEDYKYNSYKRLYQSTLKSNICKNNKVVSHQYRIRKEKEIIEKSNLPFNVDDVSLSNSELRVIDRKTAEPIIKEYEWLGYLPKYCRFYFGLYFKINNQDYLGGVETYFNKI